MKRAREAQPLWPRTSFLKKALQASAMKLLSYEATYSACVALCERLGLGPGMAIFEPGFLRTAIAGVVMIAIAVKRPDGVSSLGRPTMAAVRRSVGFVRENWRADPVPRAPASERIEIEVLPNEPSDRAWRRDVPGDISHD